MAPDSPPPAVAAVAACRRGDHDSNSPAGGAGTSAGLGVGVGPRGCEALAEAATEEEMAFLAGLFTCEVQSISAGAAPPRPTTPEGGLVHPRLPPALTPLIPGAWVEVWQNREGSKTAAKTPSAGRGQWRGHGGAQGEPAACLSATTAPVKNVSRGARSIVSYPGQHLCAPSAPCIFAGFQFSFVGHLLLLTSINTALSTPFIRGGPRRGGRGAARGGGVCARDYRFLSGRAESSLTPRCGVPRRAHRWGA